MMAKTQICKKCGTQLPTDAPAGLCPTCLVRAGLQANSPSQPELAGRPPGPAATRFDLPSIAELTNCFPQLEIVDVIGQGGMGAVYKARQPGLDRFVAVKILPPKVADEPSFSERFTREARALARLSHPNIVAVHDFGQAEGLHYIVMEFVDGPNLRELMEAGVLQPGEALSIVPQICDALQYAHDEGVVHRDIKPENILIDKTGQIKIADFGLSKLLGEDKPEDRLTGTRQVMGTPRYMAPEQMEGTHHVDHRADIFSLGVIFYEMLTGELQLGQFEPPSNKVQVDVRLDEVVLRSLANEPARRYQNASDVKSEVERISKFDDPPVQTPARIWPGEQVNESDLDTTPQYGVLLMGSVMVVLGLAFITLPEAERTHVFMIFGSVIALTGGIFTAIAFGDRLARGIRVNTGTLIQGAIFIFMGSSVLTFCFWKNGGWFVGNPGIWIGIGLVIGGSCFFPGAWKTKKRKKVVGEPDEFLPTNLPMKPPKK